MSWWRLTLTREVAVSDRLAESVRADIIRLRARLRELLARHAEYVRGHWPRREDDAAWQRQWSDIKSLAAELSVLREILESLQEKT